MKNPLRIPFFIFLIIVMASCGGRVQTEAFVVHVSEASLPFIEDSGAGIVSAMKFENPDGLFFSWIMQLVKGPEQYYLLAQTGEGNQVFRYDHGGKFMGSIGGRGNGPGEYLLAVDIATDFENNRVYVLDSYRQILVYDQDGNFLHAIGQNVASSSFTMNRQGQFFLHTAVEGGYGISLLGPSGEKILEYPKKNVHRFPIEERNFQNQQHQIYFRESFSNTVLQTDESGMRPYVSFVWEEKGYLPEYDQLNIFEIYELFAVEGKFLLFLISIVGENNIYACFSDQKEGIFNHVFYDTHHDQVRGFRSRDQQGFTPALLLNEKEQPGFFIQGIFLKELFPEFVQKLEDAVDEDAVYLVFLEFLLKR